MGAPRPGFCARSQKYTATCRQRRPVWARRAHRARRCRNLHVASAKHNANAVAAVSIEEAAHGDVQQASTRTSSPVAVLEAPEEKPFEDAEVPAAADDEPTKEEEQPQCEEAPSMTPQQAAGAVQEDFMSSLGSIFRAMASFAVMKRMSGSARGSCFQSVQAPKVDISTYLLRIQQYFKCSDECFVLCLAYIDRLARSTEVQVTNLTCHRLVLASCVVAAKFQDDEFVSNEFYARVGGIDVQEMNHLEAEFLKLLDYRLYVSPQEYNLYLQTVCGVVKV